MKIVIVGMPGVGKTSLGKRLAEFINVKFIDTDFFIEERCNMSVAGIFRIVGENGFRKVENNILKDILNSENDFVLSTGGGLPCFFDNMELINSKGISIYLFSSEQILFERISVSRKKRPLLNNLSESDLKQKISETYNFRKSFYEKAMFKIDSDEESILEKILNFVNGFKKL
jgi:shikimate kinase